MAVVKIVNEKYYGEHCIENLINYATDMIKTKGYIGAFGTNATEPGKMIQQMILVKKYFGKEKGCRQARQMVVSFSKEENVTSEMAYFMAYDIARFYSDRYQICFGVHLDTGNLHIHFVQNSVSFVDGKLFSGASYELRQFKQYVDHVVSAYLYKYDTHQKIKRFTGEQLEAYIAGN